MTFEISRHAFDEMNRRGLPQHVVDSVLENPGQIVDEYGGMKAYQSVIDFGVGKNYLVRVIVKDTVAPAKVVTVYKTSKIEKYWRNP